MKNENENPKYKSDCFGKSYKLVHFAGVVKISSMKNNKIMATKKTVYKNPVPN